MNRRDFLKAVGVGFITLGTPLHAFPETGKAITPDFDPSKVYGNGLHGVKERIEGDFGYFKGVIFREAKRTLPADVPFELRMSKDLDYGRRHGLAWVYDPDFQDESFVLIEHSDPVLDLERGFHLIGRYRT